ncbi:MAG: hypothetical protein FH749_06795 [Firmicutes bacterium]|nr:hypothetical protein [Bacillota bacterium]
MGFRIEVDVRGVEAAEKKIKSLLSAVDSTDVENVMLSGARIIKKEARGRVRGKKTGRLKRSLVAKKSKRRGNMFRSAFAAVDRKKAPHAHLYESGTVERHHRSGKSVGRMPSKPFFEPAVINKKADVEREITNGLRRIVRGSVT